MLRTMSPARRGSATAPGCSTVAATGTRSDSSMSVAETPHHPSSARSRTWDRIWIVLLLEAARPAAASLAASSSLGDDQAHRATLPAGGDARGRHGCPPAGPVPP